MQWFLNRYLGVVGDGTVGRGVLPSAKACPVKPANASVNSSARKTLFVILFLLF
jgi:hypothetical protein